MDPFSYALGIVLGNEGGVSSDPKDRASAGDGKPHTNLGITLRTVRRLDADKKLTPFLRAKLDFDGDGDIDAADVPGWNEDAARVFYEQHYWGPSGAAQIASDPRGLAVALLLFDSSVLMGVGAAIATLQRALRVDVDGQFRWRTLAAVRRVQERDSFFIDFLARRLDANRQVDSAPTHFVGWASRCFRLHIEALKV